MPPQAPPQQSTSTDLGFIMALAEDPLKALTMATTPAEVKQAQEAIKIMKQVTHNIRILLNNTYQMKTEKKAKITTYSNTNISTYLQAQNPASPASRIQGLSLIHI